MTDRWEPHADGNRWADDPPPVDQATRYLIPPFDPEGIVGPRHLHECTALTQARYHGGWMHAGAPGFLAFGGGVWFASFEGSRWCSIDESGGAEPDFDGTDGFDDEEEGEGEVSDR